jgi:hypothetical protein
LLRQSRNLEMINPVEQFIEPRDIFESKKFLVES